MGGQSVLECDAKREMNGHGQGEKLKRKDQMNWNKERKNCGNGRKKIEKNKKEEKMNRRIQGMGKNKKLKWSLIEWTKKGECEEEEK